MELILQNTWRSPERRPKSFFTNYSPSLNISALARSQLSVVVIHVWVKRAWFYVFPGSFFIFRLPSLPPPHDFFGMCLCDFGLGGGYIVE